MLSIIKGFDWEKDCKRDAHIDPIWNWIIDNEKERQRQTVSRSHVRQKAPKIIMPEIFRWVFLWMRMTRVFAHTDTDWSSSCLVSLSISLWTIDMIGIFWLLLAVNFFLVFLFVSHLNWVDVDVQFYIFISKIGRTSHLKIALVGNRCWIFSPPPI